eukprot:COSAG04_NODE_31425_length_257_cov_0.525316_1_plen_56_part_01
MNAPSAHGGSSGPSASTVEELKAAGTEALKAGSFFKQKTAYEILRSDWSSDVCSSD